MRQGTRDSLAGTFWRSEAAATNISGATEKLAKAATKGSGATAFGSCFGAADLVLTDRESCRQELLVRALAGGEAVRHEC